MAPSPPDGSRPGAQFISYDEATRFDERIVEKSRNHNDLTASASGGKKQQCGKVADGDKVVASRSSAPSKAKKSFNSRIDEDIQTKQRVKSSSSAFTRVTPGAQAVRDTPAVQRRTSSSLETLDRDIEAKNRARRSYATSGSAPQKKVAAAPSFYSLGSTATSEASATNSKSNDDDVAAKNRARSSGPSMIPGAFVATSETKPTPVSSAASYASLPASEMEVATAKNRARSSTGPAMIPGAYEAKNDNSSNMVHKDIVFGGRDYGSTRKIPSGGLDDVDMLAKQSAAPLSIGIDEGYGEQLFQKKMNAAYAGIGAEASHGGCPEKKGDGGPSRMAVQMATNNEATFINHKLGRTLGGMHGLGQMQLTIDDVEFHDLEDNKLAVATAIVEEEEDAFIPAAIEYDPDAKPPLYRNRRFRLYGFLAVVLVIFVTVVAIVIPTQVTNTDDDFGPTMAPTTFRESLGIQEQIEKYVGNAKLYDSNTSHSKALEWLLHEDPAQLSPDAENLLQRFILAVFYFHTSEQHPWLSCNPPAANETADCQYKNLAQIWPTFTYEDVPWRRWLSEKHECLWAGVFCERNKTTGIDISKHIYSQTSVFSPFFCDY